MSTLSIDAARLAALADEALAARRRLAQLADTLVTLRNGLAPPPPAEVTESVAPSTAPSGEGEPA